jgi:hypothetical protein
MVSPTMGLPTWIPGKSQISESILKHKWPRNANNIKNDLYESPILAYNKEMD